MAEDMTNTLAEAARKRKEKLLELRKKAQKNNSSEATEEEEMDAPPKKAIKFRNYVPKDETLKDRKVSDAKPEAVKELVKEHLEKAKPEEIIKEVDITNLAPRKPDWDLKRDVSKKLEKLQRRTQRAIVELIRERLVEGKEDLATAVNAVSDNAR
eukprot:gene3242-3722_t